MNPINDLDIPLLLRQVPAALGHGWKYGRLYSMLDRTCANEPPPGKIKCVKRGKEYVVTLRWVTEALLTHCPTSPDKEPEPAIEGGGDKYGLGRRRRNKR